jgi:hypothetical protein
MISKISPESDALLGVLVHRKPVGYGSNNSNIFLKKQKSENLSDKPKTPFDKPENWSV